MKTVPGEGWFTDFRLYAPTEKYFDRSWQFPHIVRVKWKSMSCDGTAPEPVRAAHGTV